ncbi:MAG: hypothetical protein ACREBW_01125 [Candidatus Micrarchaeaceae archaeon]
MTAIDSSCANRRSTLIIFVLILKAPTGAVFEAGGSLSWELFGILYTEKASVAADGHDIGRYIKMSDTTIPVRNLQAACEMVQKAGGDSAGAIGRLVGDLAVSLAHADGEDKDEELSERLKTLARSRVYRAWTV